MDEYLGPDDQYHTVKVQQILYVSEDNIKQPWPIHYECVCIHYVTETVENLVDGI